MKKRVSEAALFPTEETVYRKGESSILLMPVQAMLYVLGSVYPETGSPEINGTNDEKTADLVRCFQKIFGQEETGEIDISFWESLCLLYRSCVACGRHRPDAAL